MTKRGIFGKKKTDRHLSPGNLHNFDDRTECLWCHRHLLVVLLCGRVKGVQK